MNNNSKMRKPGSNTKYGEFHSSLELFVAGLLKTA